MVSNVLNSCLRDQKASAKPLELSNPKGRSCLSGEVLAAETLEISGVGFFFLLSELSIKVQPQILGA